MNTPLRTDTPTGDSQTPATPTPGTPLDSWTYDCLLRKVAAYTDRTTRPMSDLGDRWLDLEHFDLTSLPYETLPEGLRELYLGGCNYLLELDCAHLPKTLEVLDISNSQTLERILNLDRLPQLMTLNIENCQRIHTLPALPQHISTLKVSHCVNLEALPSLGRTCLKRLDMVFTMNLHNLPVLPDTLATLDADNNYLDELPFLPDNLKFLSLGRSRVVALGLAPERKDTETIGQYTKRVRVWWNACLRKERFDLFHEELMQKAWHPDRVAKWLEHGWEVLDNIMG